MLSRKVKYVCKSAYLQNVSLWGEKGLHCRLPMEEAAARRFVVSRSVEGASPSLELSLFQRHPLIRLEVSLLSSSILLVGVLVGNMNVAD